MKSFLIVLALVASSYALSAECEAEKEKAKACVQDLFAEAKAKKDEMKAEADACFVDNGCTLPSAPVPNPKEDSKQGGCVRKLMEQFKPQVESCMKEQDPEFAFPEKEDRPKGGHWRGGFRGGKPNRPECPSEEATAAALECLKALKSAPVPLSTGNRGQAFGSKGRRNGNVVRAASEGRAKGRKTFGAEGGAAFGAKSRTQFGSKGKGAFGGRGAFENVTKCFEEISEDCKAEEKQAKEDLCACAKQTYEDNAEEIASELAACEEGNPSKHPFNPMFLINMFCPQNGKGHGKGASFAGKQPRNQGFAAKGKGNKGGQRNRNGGGN